MRQAATSFDSEDLSLSENKNVNWMNTPGTWSFYAVVLVLTRLFLSLVGFRAGMGWTVLHVFHAVVRCLPSHGPAADRPSASLTADSQTTLPPGLRPLLLRSRSALHHHFAVACHLLRSPRS